MKSILPASRRHDVAFYVNGRIDISARIARRLSLAPGDVIDIAAIDGEWYLYVKLRAGSYVGRYVGTVWSCAKGKGTFRTCSTAITRAVLHAAGATGRLRCPCGNEVEHNNKKYITIIHRCSL